MNKTLKFPIMAVTALLIASMLVTTVSATKPQLLVIELTGSVTDPGSLTPIANGRLFKIRDMKFSGQVDVLGMPGTFEMTENSMIATADGSGKSQSFIDVTTPIGTIRIRCQGTIIGFVIFEGRFTVVEGTGFFENFRCQGTYTGSATGIYPGATFSVTAIGQFHIEPAP